MLCDSWRNVYHTCRHRCNLSRQLLHVCLRTTTVGQGKGNPNHGNSWRFIFSLSPSLSLRFKPAENVVGILWFFFLFLVKACPVIDNGFCRYVDKTSSSFSITMRQTHFCFQLFFLHWSLTIAFPFCFFFRNRLIHGYGYLFLVSAFFLHRFSVSANCAWDFGT